MDQHAMVNKNLHQSTLMESIEICLALNIFMQMKGFALLDMPSIALGWWILLLRIPKSVQSGHFHDIRFYIEKQFSDRFCKSWLLWFLWMLKFKIIAWKAFCYADFATLIDMQEKFKVMFYTCDFGYFYLGDLLV